MLHRARLSSSPSLFYTIIQGHLSENERQEEDANQQPLQRHAEDASALTDPLDFLDSLQATGDAYGMVRMPFPPCATLHFISTSSLIVHTNFLGMFTQLLAIDPDVHSRLSPAEELGQLLPFGPVNGVSSSSGHLLRLCSVRTQRTNDWTSVPPTPHIDSHHVYLFRLEVANNQNHCFEDPVVNGVPMAACVIGTRRRDGCIVVMSSEQFPPDAHWESR